MPDERLITEIETILQEVVELGAEKERTRLGPNLLVTNAAPAGLDNYILVKDDRDGDNILALKVPGVIYNTNDLVNVLFIRGGEAIAFQQGSGSSSSGIWSIVAGTSTDIFYNDGDVGIGKSLAPDARLEILDASQAQLRLTHTEDTDFVDFQIDTNADLTIKPSGTGQVIFQPTSDSIDFLQVLDADGGTPVLNIDATNERVGVKTAAPKANLQIGDGNNIFSINPSLQIGPDVSTSRIISEGTGASDIILIDSGASADEKALQIINNGGVTVVNSLLDTAFINQSNILRLDHATGRLGISSASTSQGVIQVGGATNTGGQAAMYFNASASGIGTQYGLRVVGDASGMTGGDYIFLGIHGGVLGSYSKASLWIGNEANRPGINCGYSQTITAPTHGAIVSGDVGIGTSSPQGRLHGYDAISGFIHWEYDGLDATSRTIIPNGTGDVLYELFGMYVLRDSSANTASGTFAVTNGGSTGLTVGANTVTVAVAATGATTVSRTAGSDTIKVTFWLLWL